MDRSNEVRVTMWPLLYKKHNRMIAPRKPGNNGAIVRS